MAEHEIHKITGDAEYDVVWERGRPKVGHTTNVKNHTYHCRCGETFGGPRTAAGHVEEENDD